MEYSINLQKYLLYSNYFSNCILIIFILLRIYELCCGETDGTINVFLLKDSFLSAHYPLSHFTSSFPQKGFTVSQLCASDKFCFLQCLCL